MISSPLSEKQTAGEDLLCEKLTAGDKHVCVLTNSTSRFLSQVIGTTVKLLKLNQTYGLMTKLLLEGGDLCYVLSCDFFSRNPFLVG